MAITIYDINAVSDICIILSAFYLFIKWRRLNGRMAWSFIMLGAVAVFSAVANLYNLGGDANFLFRIFTNVFLTIFLVYGISEMVKGAKPLFYSFLVYILALPGLFFGFNVSEMYAAVSLAGRIVGTAFFAYLLAQKPGEIRIMASLGLASMFLYGMITMMSVSSPATAQHFYIPKALTALMLLGFAHVSRHAPDHIYKVYKKRRG